MEVEEEDEGRGGVVEASPAMDEERLRTHERTVRTSRALRLGVGVSCSLRRVRSCQLGWLQVRHE